MISADWVNLREDVAIETQLSERIFELELALENDGWLRSFGDQWFSGDELSRNAIGIISRQARLAFLKNPLINRGVRISSYYVFGRGVNVKAKDEDINAVIQAFFDDPNNQSELFSTRARKQKDRELRIDGNLFFVLFVSPSTGHVRIGNIPLKQIEDVIRDPQNASKVWYYKRIWTYSRFNAEKATNESVTETRYYRDVNYQSDVVRVGDHDVDPNPIYHIKVGGFSDWKFGVSEVYAALDWARAYKDFLTDFVKITRSLARFAWDKQTSGGATGVQSARDKLNSRFAQSTTAVETNPSPVAGAVHIRASENEKLTPIKTAGSTTSADEGKPLRIMVGAGFGLSDSFISGDVDQGSRATATSLDRPTEFQFTDRQELWVGIYKHLIDFVLYNAVVAPNGPLASLGSVETNEYNEDVVTFASGVDPTVAITFPSILERDTESYVKAIISAFTLDGKTPWIDNPKLLAKWLLEALGFDDIDELLDELFSIEAQDNTQLAQATESIKQLAVNLAKLKENANIT
jgi:hypothetical protein